MGLPKMLGREFAVAHYVLGLPALSAHQAGQGPAGAVVNVDCVAPCGCTYELAAGVVVQYHDCAVHRLQVLKRGLA